MFLDAYHTTPLAPFATNLKETMQQITTDFIRGELRFNSANKSVIYVTDKNKSIPRFAHPILFERSGNTYVVIDVRPYTTIVPGTGELHVRSKEDMDFRLTQALLTLNAYKRKGYFDYTVIKPFAMKVFVNWVTRKVSKNMALDLGTQTRLSIITAIFFLSQFRDQVS